MFQLATKHCNLPNPAELVSIFDRVIIGQGAAKRALALAAYKHYLGLARRTDNAESLFGKQVVLLTGPTGAGKTRLVRELGRALSVPMVVCSATSFVEAGYVGDHVESLAQAALRAAGGDHERASQCIIFIEEIDKTRRAGGSSRDVSGVGVQNALLKILDGVTVMVRDGDQKTALGMHDILFVFAGAFEGLDDIVRRRSRGPQDIGFRGHSPSHDIPHGVGTAPEAQDLVDFGLVREFVGRFSTVAALRELGAAELERILVEPDGSLLDRTRVFFEQHGAELHLSGGAIRAIAEKAATLRTGARALDLVATDLLAPTMWRFFSSEKPIERIDVTRDTVERGHRARFVYSSSPSHQAPLQSTSDVTLEAADRRGSPNGKRHWTNDWYRKELEKLNEPLELEDAPEPAKKLWARLCADHEDQLGAVHYIAEQLLLRKASINEFFHSYIYSQTSDLRAVLHYLDYRRLKGKAEKEKKSAE